MRASLLSSRIFLKSLSVISVLVSVEISVEISDLTRFIPEKSLFAEAVAKKASVESVRMAMNFDFIIDPSLKEYLRRSFILPTAIFVPIFEKCEKCLIFASLFLKIKKKALENQKKTR